MVGFLLVLEPSNLGWTDLLDASSRGGDVQPTVCMQITGKTGVTVRPNLFIV